MNHYFCSFFQKYKTRNTYKRHLKVQHGKILSASGSLSDLTSEEFAKVQAAERKKEIVILKSGRTICPKKGKVETSQESVANGGILKKVSEDDFIVDYHYGDSVSNDDEVAKISAKLAEKQRRKSIVDKERRKTSLTSESSYYPSTNSEFSTPEVAEKLPEFGTEPPPGVSGVAMTVKKISEELVPIKKPSSVNLKFAPSIHKASTSNSGFTNRILTKKSVVATKPDRIVTSKPAFLAQINGQQVLLIPGPVQMGSQVVHSKMKEAEVKPVNPPPFKVQSKLEQCLRYGSAAVTQQNLNFGAKSVHSVEMKKCPVILISVENPQVGVRHQKANIKHAAKKNSSKKNEKVTMTVQNFEAAQMFSDYSVPEMVCEEVVSCDQEDNFAAPFSAEISVRIESSGSDPILQRNPGQLYHPKWSPAVKTNRDRILCDLLGIDKCEK